MQNIHRYPIVILTDYNLFLVIFTASDVYLENEATPLGDGSCDWVLQVFVHNESLCLTNLLRNIVDGMLAFRTNPQNCYLTKKS